MRLKTDNRFHKLEVTMRQVQADVDDMKKVTKNARIADLESKLVVMQTQINSLIESGHSHTRRLIALEPDNPFHGKFFEPKPKLKQLDQSVFDGLDAQWRFAAVDKNGEVWLSTHKTQPSVSGTHLSPEPKADSKHIKGAYDTTDWQSSLIERESKELTGSDLCRKMLERGDKVVLCRVSNISDEVSSRCCAPFYAITHAKFYENEGDWHFLHKQDEAFLYAVPINNQGEPLTQSEVGL